MGSPGIAISTSQLPGFVRGLPKAELHVHVEGTLEPELIFALARRNGVALAYPSVDALRAACAFTNLQSFLDIYYAGASVLLREEDFFEMAMAYFARARADGVVRAELFFDPQTHLERGVPMGTVIGGLHRAVEAAQSQHGMSAALIMCFLRHESEASAFATLDAALPYRDHIIGVGLDSSEVGHPPEKFARVFDRCRSLGFRLVAHAGEEGPAEYIRSALDLLHAERIDHGVRALDDPQLVARLAGERIPLTVCPLSNVKLRVFGSLADHNLKRLLDAGLVVTINSDDPAYFGGYVAANYLETAQALGLDAATLVKLARNSLEASFVDEAGKRRLIGRLDAYVAHAAGALCGAP